MNSSNDGKHKSGNNSTITIQDGENEDELKSLSNKNSDQEQGTNRYSDRAAIRQNDNRWRMLGIFATSVA